MKHLSALLAALVLAGSAMAAEPAAPAMTQEQAQQMMARQMQMMAALFEFRRSKLGFDETLSALTGAVDKQGWKRGQVHDVQASMTKAGIADAKRMKVLEACPAGFNDKLAQAGQGKLPPHPCRFTVLEGRDGKTYVMRMRSDMLAKGLQGEPAKLMAFIGNDEDTILKGFTE